MNPTELDDRIVAALAPAHASLNAKHGEARATLLASLSDDESFTGRRRKPAVALRYVAGGLGLSATAAAAALAAVVLFQPIAGGGHGANGQSDR